MAEPLITKYRPTSFDDVLLVGHKTVVSALERVIKSETCPHAFLFTGPSGIGKTTLARITASALEAEILEIDAASNSGVDNARMVIENGQYQSLSGSARKFYLIDEFHGMSRAAMDALLKTLEEPPSHLYFGLCTTEAHKVRETIVTRCYSVKLDHVRDSDIEELLDLVCEVEGWQPDGSIRQMVVQAATGQPRKALTLLQNVHDVKTVEEARRIIPLMEGSDPARDLLDALVNNRGWDLVSKALEKIEDADLEALSTTGASWMATAMMRTRSEEQARRIWTILDALTFPTSTFDRRAAFVAAVGRVMWGGQ